MRALAICLFLIGCNSASNRVPDASRGDGDAHRDDSGTCAEAPTCTAWNVVTACGVATTCSGGCFAGACKPDACVDECALGDSGPNGTCKLWNMTTAAFVDAEPAASLHDRARGYDRGQRLGHLAEGGVVSRIYTSADHQTLAAYDGFADSALWTGTLLAAQSWRYLATGSPDAAGRVAAMARTLHTWLNLSAGRGYLARFAAPEANMSPLYNLNCANASVHCGAMFDGVTYRWRGATSRDAYTGTMLGLMYAYLASPDPQVRAMIREDVVGFVEELIKERQDLPVRVVFNGLPFDKTIDTKFVILAPEEMTNNKVTVTVDLADLDGLDEMGGMREFTPNLGGLIGELVGISLPIPRAGSAMMVGAFYQMALAMTDGVPEMQARRGAIAADYAAQFDTLAATAAQWSYGQTCGAKYYSIHIALIMGYLWTVLETDPARKARLQTETMSALWNEVKTHKNPYFAFLNAGSRAGFTADATAMVAQLAQFNPAPRVVAARDHVADYPHDASCMDDSKPMSSVAVDVGDRVVSDFQWQRQPWKLWDAGNPLQVMAGVDYMAAYWAGRYHGLITDDRAGTCARWAPP